MGGGEGALKVTSCIRIRHMKEIKKRTKTKKQKNIIRTLENPFLLCVVRMTMGNYNKNSVRGLQPLSRPVSGHFDPRSD